MAISKRTVYLLLVIITGVLYFLYSLSAPENDFNRFYKLTEFIKGGNISQSKPSVMPTAVSEDDSVIVPVPTTHMIKPNVTKLKEVATPVKKAKIKESSSTKPVVSSKKSDVIQQIPPKPSNKTTDFIDQGVITRTLYDSGFIIPNVAICPDFGGKLQLAVLIASAPKNGVARIAIRQTWGHYQQRSDVAIAFLIGKASEKEMTSIREESTLYGDIIQANFIDSYNNLTLKTISLLEWVDNYCHKVKYILKTDDDMFINIPKLLTFLSKHPKDKRRIYGRLAKKWKPIRNKNSKYFVSVQQYKNPLFPDFTTGPAYVMTSDVINEMYTTALNKTYLKLEDVYSTGIVAQDRKIQRVHVNEFFNRRVTLSACNVQKGISIHMIKPFEQYDLWKKLLDGRSKC